MQYFVDQNRDPNQLTYLTLTRIRETGPQLKTIDSIDVEDKYEGDGQEFVVVFNDQTKLRLSTTREIDLKQLFGDDTDSAIGQAVEIFAGQVPRRGTDTLRIRLPQTSVTHRDVKMAEKDDIPY